MTQDDPDMIYATALAERDRHTETILRSSALRKIVVAGPGTGKTTLFAQLLARRRGNALTLSFINALVDELALALYGISEVRTLHGFSRSVLHRTKRAKIYPNLPQVIGEDAAILLAENGIDFDKMFCQYEDNERLIEFYKKRKDYYGNYYGFTDAIYAVAKFFEIRRNKISKYDQIVVDEF